MSGRGKKKTTVETNNKVGEEKTKAREKNLTVKEAPRSSIKGKKDTENKQKETTNEAKGKKETKPKESKSTETPKETTAEKKSRLAKEKENEMKEETKHKESKSTETKPKETATETTNEAKGKKETKPKESKSTETKPKETTKETKGKETVKEKDNKVTVGTKQKENAKEKLTEKSEDSESSSKKKSPVKSKLEHKEKTSKFLVFSTSVDKNILDYAKALGGVRVEKNVIDTTTHLIISNEGRTMKVLEALSRGIFIVTQDWIEDSHKEGKWLDEEKYEATKAFPGAKKIRLSHKKKDYLFKDLTFHVNPNIRVGDNTTRVHIERMIQRNGGETKSTITKDLDYAIVCTRNATEENSKTHNIKVDWIWDALATFTKPDVDSKPNYKIQKHVPKANTKKKKKEGRKGKPKNDTSTTGEDGDSENVEDSEKSEKHTEKKTKKRERASVSDSEEEVQKNKKTKTIEETTEFDLTGSPNLYSQ